MHIEKETYNESIIKLRHDLRLSKTYKNKDIDLNKSNQNYSLHTWEPFEKYEKRINEIYIYGKNGKNKDKINYMCSLIVQYPVDCEISEREFFEKMAEILMKRFGIENTISIQIHNDENEKKGRSHMHFKWVPCVKMEKEKNGYTEKLCAKDVVNRDMLLTLHQDIEEDFLKYYNLKISLRSKEPRKYINDIYEFKEAQEKNEKLKIENEKLKNKYNYLVDLYNKALTKLTSIKEFLNYQKSKERTR